MFRVFIVLLMLKLFVLIGVIVIVVVVGVVVVVVVVVSVVVIVIAVVAFICFYIDIFSFHYVLLFIVSILNRCITHFQHFSYILLFTFSLGSWQQIQ